MKRLITEDDIQRLVRKGSSTLALGKNDLVTPLAHDAVKQHGISIIERAAPGAETKVTALAHTNIPMNKVVVGCDHTALEVKAMLSAELAKREIQVIDVGTFTTESCDYPDTAAKVAKKIQAGEAAWGIVIDATGNPSAITVNKFKGIRAAVCYNEFSTASAREHNNANVMAVGAQAIGPGTIKSILDVWLKTSFGGGRHLRRIGKIATIENESMKSD